MAHILIDKDKRCTCSCADTCAVKPKCGSMARCTEEELVEAGYKVIEMKPVRIKRFLKKTLNLMEVKIEGYLNL